MGYREFKDEHGVDWRVWDVVPGSVERRAPNSSSGHLPPEGERRARVGDSQEVRLRMRPGWERGWLSFESDAEKKRLAPIPKDWEEAPVEAIREWLAEAASFPKRGSFIE